MRKTNEMKREEVRRALSIPEVAKYSNGVIADSCEVSSSFVMRVRKEMAEEGFVFPTKRITSTGRLVETANVGMNMKKQEKKNEEVPMINEHNIIRNTWNTEFKKGDKVSTDLLYKIVRNKPQGKDKPKKHVHIFLIDAYNWGYAERISKGLYQKNSDWIQMYKDRRDTNHDKDIVPVLTKIWDNNIKKETFTIPSLFQSIQKNRYKIPGIENLKINIKDIYKFIHKMVEDGNAGSKKEKGTTIFWKIKNTNDTSHKRKEDDNMLIIYNAITGEFDSKIEKDVFMRIFFDSLNQIVTENREWQKKFDQVCDAKKDVEVKYSDLQKYKKMLNNQIENLKGSIKSLKSENIKLTEENQILTDSNLDLQNKTGHGFNTPRITKLRKKS